MLILKPEAAQLSQIFFLSVSADSEQFKIGSFSVFPLTTLYPRREVGLYPGRLARQATTQTHKAVVLEPLKCLAVEQK